MSWAHLNYWDWHLSFCQAKLTTRIIRQTTIDSKTETKIVRPISESIHDHQSHLLRFSTHMHHLFFFGRNWRRHSDYSWLNILLDMTFSFRLCQKPYIVAAQPHLKLSSNEPSNSHQKSNHKHEHGLANIITKTFFQTKISMLKLSAKNNLYKRSTRTEDPLWAPS